MYKWASIAHSLQYQTIQWPPKYITAQKERIKMDPRAFPWAIWWLIVPVTKMGEARGRSKFKGEIKSPILDTSLRCLLNLPQKKLKSRTQSKSQAS